MSVRVRTSRATAARLVIALSLVGQVALGWSTAIAEVGKQALVLDPSVSGGSSSQEAQRAAALGFTVDVVSDATWNTMTAVDFAQYQLVIVGDPTCSVLSQAVSQNATALADAVMARAGGNTKAGNRILIGTDPVFHHSQGGFRLIETGIEFAGVQEGATGLYLDFTCHDADYNGNGIGDAEELLLPQLTIDTPNWSQNQFPPCGGSVSLISNSAQFATLQSSHLQGWFCSTHESFPTFPTDWSPLAIATDTPTAPTCGRDVDTGAAVCGEAYILIAGSGIVVEAPNISLTPLTAENPVGTSHTVTATVTDQDGTPKVGQLVSFVVTGANAGASGTCAPPSCETDADGKVSFTYTGANAGDDTINASITVDGSTQKATAAKTWTEQRVAAVELTPETATNPAGEQHCVTATVTDGAGGPAAGVSLVFSVAGANTASGTGTSAPDGTASFCYTGTNDGDDTITVFADIDGDGTHDADEPSDTASKRYTAAAPSRLSLTPPSATNEVDSEHCVTATVTDAFGNPVAGVTVIFTVGGANGASGTAVTDGNGQAVFCYTGVYPGDDDIDAFADADGDGANDADEPEGSAAKRWVVTNTTGCKITMGGQIVAANGDPATYGGNAHATSPAKGQVNYVDHGPASAMHVRSLGVDAVRCSSDRTAGSIFGTADVDGSGPVAFRVDVRDLGERGTSDTFRIRLATGYDSGDQILNGGNVQIHK